MPRLGTFAGCWGIDRVRAFPACPDEVSNRVYKYYSTVSRGPSALGFLYASGDPVLGNSLYGISSLHPGKWPGRLHASLFRVLKFLYLPFLPLATVVDLINYKFLFV